jgi:hypothetical protein
MYSNKLAESLAAASETEKMALARFPATCPEPVNAEHGSARLPGPAAAFAGFAAPSMGGVSDGL